MALSNAERQRRYRQKLKKRASPDGVGDLARAAVERAIQALWAFHQRPGPGGIDWAMIDGCATLAEYRSELERGPGNLVQAARAFLPDFAGLTPEEARAIAVVIEISDALRLAPRRAFAVSPEGRREAPEPARPPGPGPMANS